MHIRLAHTCERDSIHVRLGATVPVRKHSMIELLKSILAGHNQFASGGLLLMLLGGIGVYLRAIPHNLWRWFLDQVTMSITIRSEEHTSELQSPVHLVCRLLLEKKKIQETMDVHKEPHHV